MNEKPILEQQRQEGDRDMTQKDVLRYLYLVDRRLTILTSGVHWKPEYETELKDIDKELSELRFLADEERKKK